MRNITKKLTLSGVALATVLFSGCGSSSTTSSSGSSGTAVDPYISQAKFYVVGSSTVGADGLCGSKTAYISTATTSAGAFSFTETVPTDAVVKICQDYKGYHNGAAFDSNLSTKFDSSNTAGVLSPMTTMVANGMSASDIASVLNDPDQNGDFSDGVGYPDYNITTTDVYGDPMSGLASASLETNTTFAKIRATVAINMMMNMRNEFNMTSISDMNQSGYLSNGISMMKSAISTDLNGTGLDASQIAFVGTSISEAISENVALLVSSGASAGAIATEMSNASGAISALGSSLGSQMLANPTKTFRLRKGATWGASTVVETIPAGSDLNVTGRMIEVNNDRNITFYTDSTYSELNTTSNLIQWGLYSLSDSNVSVSLVEDNVTGTISSSKVWTFNGDTVKLNGGVDLNITDVNSSINISLTAQADLNGTKIILASDTVTSRSFDTNGTYRQMETNNTITSGVWSFYTGTTADYNVTLDGTSTDVNVSWVSPTVVKIDRTNVLTKTLAEKLKY